MYQSSPVLKYLRTSLHQGLVYQPTIHWHRNWLHLNWLCRLEKHKSSLRSYPFQLSILRPKIDVVDVIIVILNFNLTTWETFHSKTRIDIVDVIIVILNFNLTSIENMWKEIIHRWKLSTQFFSRDLLIFTFSSILILSLTSKGLV